MAKGRLKETAGQAAEKARQVRDSAQAAIGQAAQKAGEVAGKAKDKAVETAGKALDLAGTAADRAKEGTQALVQKVQDGVEDAKAKKYRPVAYDDFISDEFNLPDMILVVDNESVKKKIYKDKMGWMSTEKEMTVFHLIDKETSLSNLQFYPAARTNTIYYIDPNNKQKFVRVDAYFSYTYESKLAELERVAFSLGAKKSNVTIEEVITEGAKSKKKGLIKGKGKEKGVKVNADISATMETEIKSKRRYKARSFADFSGNNDPVKPELVWFKDNDLINNVIDMRCSNVNGIKRKTIELEEISFASMDKEIAAKIDAAVDSLGLGGNESMSDKWNREINRKMIFHIEF